MDHAPRQHPGLGHVVGKVRIDWFKYANAFVEGSVRGLVGPLMPGRRGGTATVKATAGSPHRGSPLVFIVPPARRLRPAAPSDARPCSTALAATLPFFSSGLVWILLATTPTMMPCWPSNSSSVAWWPSRLARMRSKPDRRAAALHVAQHHHAHVALAAAP